MQHGSLNMDDLKREINKYGWWHTIDLGNGIVTPGTVDTYSQLKLIGMPDDLRGLSVLDIGACDGFYSFESERRGAKRVLAADLPAWGTSGRENQKAKFELCRRILCSKVEDKEIDVYDIFPQNVGIFDLVLFLGVLYHLKHPLLALERIFNVVGKQLILETHIDMVELKKPVAAFYPNTELQNDPTNWWGPNEAAVIAMLKVVGFTRIHVFSRVFNQAKQGRIVVHAWR